MNETLKALREQNNYSQAAVAAYLDVSRQMYIKYENGDAVPPVKIVTQLSNFYRVPYDVILEDKLNSKYQKAEGNKTDFKYAKKDTAYEVHEPAPAYGVMDNSPSYYLKSILEMLPKLVYKEQLKVLEKLTGLVQKATQEKLKPKMQSTFYESLNELNNKYHPKSDGKKWTREELYER